MTMPGPDVTPNIHDLAFVEGLFDEMAGTYERVNFITSFGFSRRWRRQFIQKLALQPGMTVCDLMCGMGECWTAVRHGLRDEGRILALDISNGMLHGALRNRPKLGQIAITVSRQDACSTSLPAESVDCVMAGFGLKTLSDGQLATLFQEVRRILKPGGVFSFVEVSVPSNQFLKKPYMFYLKRIIPLVGRLLRGNPSNYRYLGIYSERFGNCRRVMPLLANEGLVAEYHDYFMGCATGVSGHKPAATSSIEA
jgi:demethylmenaquinone methyltransferase/2-methoxy-6-polyprenyl-1,4-benzoquinol methylase